MTPLALLLLTAIKFPGCLCNLTSAPMSDMLEGPSMATFEMEESAEMTPIYEETVEANRSNPYYWGFYVYRTTYQDQDLWDRYMGHIHTQAAQYFSNLKYRDELLPLLQFTVVEDRARLDGASKEDVRQMFQDMVKTLPEGGDVTRHIPPKQAREMVRYQYCMYVDDESLDSFAKLDWQKINAKREQIQRVAPWLQFISPGRDACVVVIFGDQSSDDDDGYARYPEDEEEDEEGQESGFWMPVECRWLAWFYVQLTVSNPDCWEQGMDFCFEGNPGGKAVRAWREPPWGEDKEEL